MYYQQITGAYDFITNIDVLCVNHFNVAAGNGVANLTDLCYV